MASARMPAVYVVTGPIQTGKTTRLRAWADSKNHSEGSAPVVDGILAPVIGGARHLLHAASGELRNLEEIAQDDPVVTVRRFRFNADVFAWARNLLATVSDQTAWVIVDEIGPLELRGGGLEPAVTELLARYGAGTARDPSLDSPPDSATHPDIVLVVRDTLLEQALGHFGLAKEHVLPFNFP